MISDAMAVQSCLREKIWELRPISRVIVHPFGDGGSSDEQDTRSACYS